jgi:hypothetical protein
MDEVSISASQFDELIKHNNNETKEHIARSAANNWCRCFKCDEIVRDTNSPCDKEKLLTCHQWYDGYRTALLALGDERIKELL